MTNQLPKCDRRKFVKSSSIMILAGLLPGSLYSSKASLGSSITIPITYKNITIGVKLTLVNNKYMIVTIGQSRGERLSHFFIQKPTGKTRATKATVEIGESLPGSITLDGQKVICSTTLRGYKIGRIKFENSNNDDIPNAEGFLGWLGDKISDAAKAVAATIARLNGGAVGEWETSNGGKITVKGTKMSYTSKGSSGFKAEDGLEEENGVWY